MIDYFISNLWLFWSIIALVCLILELSSGDFFVTCFAIGAICGVLATFTGMPFWGQVIVFAVFSVLSIWFIRPALLRHLHKAGEERVSNVDALLDRIGEVSETIEADGYGRVKLDGDDWKAVSADKLSIEKGTKVKIVGRDSIIITVERV